MLNSPLLWWHNWRFLGHLKDEALNPAGFRMEQLPVARPTSERRDQISELARQLVDLEERRSSSAEEFLDWLRVEYEIEKPGHRLEAPFELTSDELVAEVRKRRGKKALSAAALKSLRARSTPPRSSRCGAGSPKAPTWSGVSPTW